MKLTKNTRRLGKSATRLLTFCSLSLLSLICVAASTFCLNLRTDASSEPSSSSAVTVSPSQSGAQAQPSAQVDPQGTRPYQNPGYQR